MSAIGLCEHCRHVQIVQNARGSKFYLCRRANEDASFAKYPRLPVLTCRGYELPGAALAHETEGLLLEKNGLNSRQ